MNALKKDLRYFVVQAFRNLGTSLLTMLLLAVYGYLFFRADTLWSMLSLGLLGGAFCLLIIFLQQQCGVVPLALGFSSTRRSLFWALEVEKLLVSVLLACLTWGGCILMEVGDFSGLSGLCAFFSLVLFACSFGQFGGSLQHISRRWGIIALAAFWVLFIGAVILFLWANGWEFSTAAIARLFWPGSVVLLALSALCTIATGRMMRQYAV